MENVGVLISSVILLLIFLPPLLLMIRLILNRNDGKKHIVSWMLLLVTGLPATFLIGSNLIARYKARTKFLGTYKLGRFNCEDCKNCSLVLFNDNTYEIRQNKSKLLRGWWYLTSAELGRYSLVLENGPQNTIFDSPRTIPYVNTISCQKVGNADK